MHSRASSPFAKKKIHMCLVKELSAVSFVTVVGSVRSLAINIPSLSMIFSST